MEWITRISTTNKKTPAICPSFDEFEELAKEHLKKASEYFTLLFKYCFSHFIFRCILKRHLRVKKWI